MLPDMASCRADTDAEPLGLLPAKRLKTSDWKKCLICQVENKEPLRKASATGIIALLAASKQRRDEVFKRIESHVDELQSRNVVWHGTCYGPYTNKRNLSFIHLVDTSPCGRNCETVPIDPEKRSSRSNTCSIDWSLCLFCQKAKHKGSKALVNVSSFDSCKSIVEAAEARGDDAFLISIRDVDLIAVDAKYHSACRASYVSKPNLKHQTYKEENTTEECKYEEAFQDLLDEINPGIVGGKAYEMSFLVERYRMMLTLKGMDLRATEVKNSRKD